MAHGVVILQNVSQIKVFFRTRLVICMIETRILNFSFHFFFSFFKELYGPSFYCHSFRSEKKCGMNINDWTRIDHQKKYSIPFRNSSSLLFSLGINELYVLEIKIGLRYDNILLGRS